MTTSKEQYVLTETFQFQYDNNYFSPGRFDLNKEPLAYNEMEMDWGEEEEGDDFGDVKEIDEKDDDTEEDEEENRLGFWIDIIKEITFDSKEALKEYVNKYPTVVFHGEYIYQAENADWVKIPMFVHKHLQNEYVNGVMALLIEDSSIDADIDYDCIECIDYLLGEGKPDPFYKQFSLMNPSQFYSFFSDNEVCFIDTDKIE